MLWDVTVAFMPFCLQHEYPGFFPVVLGSFIEILSSYSTLLDVPCVVIVLLVSFDLMTYIHNFLITQAENDYFLWEVCLSTTDGALFFPWIIIYFCPQMLTLLYVPCLYFVLVSLI